MYMYKRPGAIRALPIRAQGGPQGPCPFGWAHKGPGTPIRARPIRARPIRAQGTHKGPAHKGPRGPSGPGP